MRRSDPKPTDELMRGQEAVVPQSAITVREHLELEIASQAKHLESIIQNQARQLELQIEAQDRRFLELRTETELRYMQLRAADELALRAALTSAEKAVQTALQAAKEAVVKAEVATEKRLEGLNELRQGVATKDALDALTLRLGDLKETVATMQASMSGRAGGLKDWIGWVVALVTIVSAFVGFAILLRGK